MSEAVNETFAIPDDHPLFDQLRKGPHAYTQSFTEDVQAFAHAVDWDKDRWIFGIFAIEALIYLFVLCSRKHTGRLCVIFMLNAFILVWAEKINSAAAEHWEKFSTQQYFDKSGVFASVIVGVPLIICQFLIVVLLLWEASKMVVKVKRVQIRKELAEKKKENKAD